MCTKEQCTLTALYVHACKRSLITIVHFVNIRATNMHTVWYLASRGILIMINGTASCEQFKISWLCVFAIHLHYLKRGDGGSFEFSQRIYCIIMGTVIYWTIYVTLHNQVESFWLFFKYSDKQELVWILGYKPRALWPT